MSRFKNLSISCPRGYAYGYFNEHIIKLMGETKIEIDDGLIIMGSTYERFEIEKDGHFFNVSVLAFGGEVSITITQQRPL
jgi:hypothetical protein